MNNKRNENWGQKEINVLIGVWGEYINDLRGRQRNGKVYVNMTRCYNGRAKELPPPEVPERTPVEIRNKVANLARQWRNENKKMVSGAYPSTWEYFHAIRPILGNLPINDSSRMTASASLASQELHETAAASTSHSQPKSVGDSLQHQLEIFLPEEDPLVPVEAVIEEEQKMISMNDSFILDKSENLTAAADHEEVVVPPTSPVISPSSPPSPVEQRTIEEIRKRKRDRELDEDALFFDSSQDLMNKRKEIQQYIFTLLASYKREKDYQDALMASLDSPSIPAPKRTCWSKERANDYWECIVPAYTDQEFRRDFRVCREVFALLERQLHSSMFRQDTNMREAIPVSKRIAIGLTCLTSCAKHYRIATLFGVSAASVSGILREFVSACIENLMPMYLKFPSTRGESMELINDFSDLRGFPSCIGAIDGCHIPVCPPKAEVVDHQDSKVLLAVVDARYRFIYINCSATGHNNDPYIFDCSSLPNLIAQDIFDNPTHIEGIEVKPFLIGDLAFKLTDRMMKPFLDRVPLSSVQENFNRKLDEARIVVEVALGCLKARFRILYKRTDVNPDLVPLIIQACCVLHNICETFGDSVDFDWVRESQEAERLIEQEPQGQSQTINSVGCGTLQGTLVRNALAQHLYNIR